jgi:hypothetical protein
MAPLYQYRQRSYIDDRSTLAQLAWEVAANLADKGFTSRGLDAQIAWKAAVIGAVESFLMSHWDASDVPMTNEDVITFAQGTLAYSLADADTIRRLFHIWRGRGFRGNHST